MATNFTRPTLAAIIDRVSTDIESNLSGVTARLRRRAEYAYARAIAGVSHSLHGHIAWAAEQILPDTAAERFVLRWGSLLGVTRKAAVAAVLTVDATGTGGTLTAGTDQIVRTQDGSLYSINSTVAAITTATSVTITAIVASETGNVADGQELNLSSPVANVDTIVTVTGTLTAGTDEESLADYVERIVDRMQHPPMGGARGDHTTWALEVAGVTRAWEYAGQDGYGNPSLGKVALTFMCDDDPGTYPDGIPDASKVDEVQAYLDARSPAEVIVYAPTPVDFDYDITVTPTGTADAAIEAEVADMLTREAEPGTAIALSKLDEAISVAAGEISHVINSSSANTVPAFDEIYIYGTATLN